MRGGANSRQKLSTLIFDIIENIDNFDKTDLFFSEEEARKWREGRFCWTGRVPSRGLRGGHSHFLEKRSA
jgi:hypothetical protein